MAFADASVREVLAAGPQVEVVLGGAVNKGDPIVYVAGSTGYVQADANGSGTYPVELFALTDGADEATIKAASWVVLNGVTGGTPGGDVYLSDTVGRYGESTGTYAQVLGISATATTMALGIVPGGASISGVTSTAAELNLLDDCTVTTAELNLLDGQLADVVFSIGDEAAENANEIIVGIQANDAAGSAMAIRSSFVLYLSDDANGDSVAASAPSGHAIGGTDGVAIPLVTDKTWQVVTETDGDADMVVVQTGDKTFYLIAVMPTGKLVASAAITFAT